MTYEIATGFFALTTVGAVWKWFWARVDADDAEREVERLREERREQDAMLAGLASTASDLVDKVSAYAAEEARRQAQRIEAGRNSGKARHERAVKARQARMQTAEARLVKMDDAA